MEEYNVGKIIKNVIVVLLILIAFYFLTVVILDNKEDETTNNVTSEIQYEEIRLSLMKEQAEDEYYVLVELESDISNVYPYLTSLKSLTELNAYTATLDNVYNEKYYSETSDFNLEKPIFSQTTLVKIKNKEISGTYEGVNSITEYVSGLSGEDNE